MVIRNLPVSKVIWHLWLQLELEMKNESETNEKLGDTYVEDQGSLQMPTEFPSWGGNGQKIQYGEQTAVRTEIFRVEIVDRQAQSRTSGKMDGWYGPWVHAGCRALTTEATGDLWGGILCPAVDILWLMVMMIMNRNKYYPIYLSSYNFIR